jgi:hypothetical protein
MMKIVVTAILIFFAAIQPIKAESVRAASPEALAQQFVMHFKAKDIDAILTLFRLDGVDDKTRDSLKMHISSEFGKNAGKPVIKTEPYTGPTVYTLQDVTYEMDPTRKGMIDFPFEENKSGVTSLSLHYGEKDNSYYFVTAIPKK